MYAWLAPESLPARGGPSRRSRPGRGGGATLDACRRCRPTRLACRRMRVRPPLAGRDLSAPPHFVPCIGSAARAIGLSCRIAAHSPGERMARDPRLPLLTELEKKVLWLSTWTIHNANHLRDGADGLKVGGHQASSASLATIMTALYFAVLRPRGPGRRQAACEPDLPRHPVSPRQPDAARSSRISAATRARSPIRRAPRTSTTSTSRPARSASASRRRSSPASSRITSSAHGWAADRPEGRMIALVGDAEMDEGNIFEALLEGWKQGLRNTLVDHRLQPPEPRCGRARGPLRALRGAVPRLRLGRGHPQVRLAHAGGLPRARRRAAARLDRQLPRTSSIPPSPSRAAPPGGSASSTISATRAPSRA